MHSGSYTCADGFDMHSLPNEELEERRKIVKYIRKKRYKNYVLNANRKESRFSKVFLDVYFHVLNPSYISHNL